MSIHSTLQAAFHNLDDTLRGQILGMRMGTIRTITVGSCISVQGNFERDLGNGHITVRVGQMTYTGKPVARQDKHFTGRAS